MSDKKSSSNATGTSLATFYGVKAGMTRIFDKAGNHVPVTVIKLIPNVISQVKTKENDGYEAYQVSYNEKREKLGTKAIKGHLKKATIKENLSEASEIKVEGVSADLLGQALTYDNFQADTYVDVTGLSKGKGTQGVMKRYNFRGGPASHGSHFHRRPGSIGNRATPARVFPEKKMPGRMGVENVTTQNLKIVEVNIENGYMLIKGSVPGGKNGYVKVARATKKA
ncbi:MAG: 50S ribosomal protein L3 [Bacteriovoracaceae bacterium]|nr:50S ribosomal protein L3 [Bacteriovoracaceae bacterium]